jgi:hypothetical protein
VTLTDEAQRPCYLALSHASVSFFLFLSAAQNRIRSILIQGAFKTHALAEQCD